MNRQKWSRLQRDYENSFRYGPEHDPLYDPEDEGHPEKCNWCGKFCGGKCDAEIDAADD